jgi:hypothetical protein
MVDLAITFPINHPPCLTLCGTTRGTRQSTAFVAVFNSLDVAKVSGEAI